MRAARSGPFLLCVLGLALAPASCRTDFGYPPVARIALMPGYVRQGDAFQTDVTVDGSGSADPINAPDAGSGGLRFSWSFWGDNVQITRGTTQSPSVVVRTAGQHTVTVQLTVTSPQGLSDTATAVIGLSVSDGGLRD